MRHIILSLILALSMQNINAQTENGFKAVEVLDSFEINPFTYFVDAPVLAAGDKNNYNAMTIGWGGMGTLWGEKSSSSDCVCGTEEIYTWIYGEVEIFHCDAVL